MTKTSPTRYYLVKCKYVTDKGWLGDVYENYEDAKRGMGKCDTLSFLDVQSISYPPTKIPKGYLKRVLDPKIKKKQKKKT